MTSDYLSRPARSEAEAMADVATHTAEMIRAKGSMKHTAGLWEVGARRISSVSVKCGDRAIASVHASYGGLRCTPESWQAAHANARLIAAAPVLLDALRAMVATVDAARGQPVTFHEGMKDCSVTKARAALALADGGQK